MDLTLQERGTVLEPAAPVVPVRISKRASDGVVLGGFRFASKDSAADATATTFADKAFFANTQTDTDFMVGALPSGAEASWVLRSSDSPERLALQLALPTGASLVVDPDLSTGAAVQRGDEILARIAPPIAVDADGSPLPASYELVGSALGVKVAHRQKDVKYPILVDPSFAIIYGNGPVGNPGTYAGWKSMRNCGMLQFSAQSASPLHAYYPSNVGIANGCWGRWRYTAPGSAYVYQADFANLNHWGSGGNGLWYGILNADGTWSSPGLVDT